MGPIYFLVMSLEALFGRLYFIGLYLLAGLFGSLLSSYINIQNGHELLQHFDQSLLPSRKCRCIGRCDGIRCSVNRSFFISTLATSSLHT